MLNITRRTKQTMLIIMVVLWVAMIFSFSLHSGKASHLQSSTVEKSIKAIFLTLHIPICRDLYNVFSSFALPGEIVNGEYFIRKSAHSFEYGTFGILMSFVYVSIRKTCNTQNHYAPLLYFCGPIIAIVDEEIIQKYVVTQRTSSYKDVILDTIAFSFGFIVTFILFQVKSKKI